MIISIFGTNGMLSTYLSKLFFQDKRYILNLYGIEKPTNYLYTNYNYIDLLNDEIDYDSLLKSDLIIYASGAGVQAALNTKSELMFHLNLHVPIKICNKLKEYNYKGIYISFGSYMEIGLNADENISFDETQIKLSPLLVTNDYALSKRLLTRFMGDLFAPYQFWHFILPNIFVKDEEGTRLIPYVLDYLRKTSNGELCDLPRFSSGEQIRQYISLEDIGMVILSCIKYNICSGIYNIGGGEVMSIKELITRLFNYYNLPISDKMFSKEVRRDGDIKSLKINGKKLENAIGYQPHQKIESIL